MGNAEKKILMPIVAEKKIKEIYGNRIRRNLLDESIEFDGNRLNDTIIRTIRQDLLKRKINVSIAETQTQLEIVADINAYNPLVDYLKSIKWDGIDRLSNCAAIYFNADEDIHNIFFRKWLISAVSRAINPGNKVDTVLILDGDQGIGKSTAFAILGGDHFSGAKINIDSKDSWDQMHGKWIIEFAELTSLTKKDVENVKEFITRQTDVYRRAYDRLSVYRPRTFILAGTVNGDDIGWVRDTTGNRRFMIIDTNKIETDKLKEDRDQLWAEAYSRYLKNEPWWLTKEEEAIGNAIAADKIMVPDWAHMLPEIVEKISNGNPFVKTCDINDSIKIYNGGKPGGALLGNEMKKLGWISTSTRVANQKTKGFRKE
jgi:predicted P-loop ATPase